MKANWNLIKPVERGPILIVKFLICFTLAVVIYTELVRGATVIRGGIHAHGSERPSALP